MTFLEEKHTVKDLLKAVDEIMEVTDITRKSKEEKVAFSRTLVGMTKEQVIEYVDGILLTEVNKKTSDEDTKKLIFLLLRNVSEEDVRNLMNRVLGEQNGN